MRFIHSINKVFRLMMAGIPGLMLLSCSTMTFIPTEGTAAKFNLATVEYVEAQNTANRNEIVKEVTADMDSIIDSLLTEDREKVAELSRMLEEYEATLAKLDSRIDSTNQSLSNVSGKLVRDMSEVRSSTQNMQMYIDKLNEDLDALPRQALSKLRDVLDSYVNENTGQDKDADTE